MQPIQKFSGRVVSLPMENVDTDQIIPARFLKTTVKSGLGKVLFHDWRFGAEGRPVPDFVLNRAGSEGASILLAGGNFGCGSSREHAPWALLDHGFRAVVSTSFADIFRNNCLKNGLLPVQVEKDFHERFSRLLEADPALVAQIDLEGQTLTLPDGDCARFPIDAFSRRCLLDGVDELGYLLAHAPSVAAFEQATGR
jgi:3-isopropylmalate/(R)-2-methylmalate dehydratase small subunit